MDFRKVLLLLLLLLLLCWINIKQAKAIYITKIRFDIYETVLCSNFI